MNKTNAENDDSSGCAIPGSTAGAVVTWANNMSSVNAVLARSKSITPAVKDALGSTVNFVSSQNLADNDKVEATIKLLRITEQLDKPKGQEDKVVIANSLEWMRAAFTGASTVKALHDAIATYLK